MRNEQSFDDLTTIISAFKSYIGKSYIISQCQGDSRMKSTMACLVYRDSIVKLGQWLSLGQGVLTEVIMWIRPGLVCFHFYGADS